MSPRGHCVPKPLPWITAAAVLSPVTPHLPLGPCLDPALAQPVSQLASCSLLAFVWN